MAKSTSLENVFSRVLSGQTRVSHAIDLGGRRAHNSGFSKAIYFEYADRKILGCLDLQRGVASSFSFAVGRYEARPGSDPLDQVPRLGLGHTFVFYADEADLEAKVGSVLENFVRHADLFDWQPPDDARYWAAFTSLLSERNAWSARLPDLLWFAIRALKASSEPVRIGRGLGIVCFEEPEKATVHGLVPAHLRIAISGAADPTPELAYYYYGPKAVLSPPEAHRIAFDWLSDGIDQVDRGARWEMLVPGPTYFGDRDAPRAALSVLPGRVLLPSKELVLAMQHERYKEFANFIANLPEDAWRAAYDGTAPPADVEGTLLAAVEKDATSFHVYKRLADHFTAAGDTGRASLWLGIGYVRAYRVPSVAEAKLKLAALSDPNMPGLAEAFAELATLRR